MKVKKNLLAWSTQRASIALLMTAFIFFGALVLASPFSSANAASISINFSCDTEPGFNGTCPDNNTARWGADRIVADVAFEVDADGSYTIEIMWTSGGPSDSFTDTFTTGSQHSVQFEYVYSDAEVGTHDVGVRLLDNAGEEPVEVASTSSEAVAERRDVTLTAPDLPTSAKWWFGFTVPNNSANPIVITDDATGDPIEGLPSDLFFFDGDAVDGAPVTADGTATNADGELPSTQLVASQNTGEGREVKINFEGNDLYNSHDPVSTMMIEKHDISLSDPSLEFSSLEWYFANDVSSEATDIDAAGVDSSKTGDIPENPSDIPVTFDGDAVDSPVIASTGSPAEATFIVSQDTGAGKSVVATSTATSLYKSGTSGTTMTILKHDIELSLVSIADEFWDLDTSFTGGATDTDAGGIDPSKTVETPGPAGLSISFTGLGADSLAGPGSAGIASVLTILGGTYSATGFAPYAPPATDWEVMTHSAETALYLPDDSPSIFYDTLKHTTLLDLDFRDEIINVANAGHPGNPLDPADDIISFVDSALTPTTTDLRSVQQDQRFAVGGTLIDTAYPFTDIAAKPIRFEFDPGISGLATVTTTPVTFEGSSIAVDACPVGTSDCSRDALDPFGGDATLTSNMYVSIGVGDKINFPAGTLSAVLHLQNNGDNNFSYIVYQEDDSTRTGCVSTEDNDFLHVALANINPTPSVDASGNQIVIAPVAFELSQDAQGGSCSSPAALLNIAGLVLKADDARNPPTQTYAMSFENETPGSKSSPYSVHPGAFTSFGVAGSASLDDVSIMAVFDEDTDYLASDKTGFIDIRTTTETGGLVGAGGNAVVVTEDTPDFTSYACSMPREIGGNDLDYDGICDDIEIGNSINVGGASLTLDSEGLNDVAILFKDIYVEMDGMTNNIFAPSTVDEIEAIFDTGVLPAADFDGIQRPYKLHIVRDETITESFPTKVWTDTSSSWLSGSPSISITDPGPGNPADLTRQFTISGLSLRTTGAVTSHTLQMKFLLDFSASPGADTRPTVTTPTTAAGTLAFGKSSYISSISSSSVSVTGTGLLTDQRLITLTLTFSTSCVAVGDCALDTDDEGALGTTTFNLNLPSGKSAVTLQDVDPTSGTPQITNNKNFDGIKKNYFGTKAERDAAGGTLGQRVDDLVAKLSFYHYVEVVRTTGATTSVCGSSGWAEDGGNDFIISLGQRSGPVACFTGVAGSVDEQKGTFLHELGHNLGLHHGGDDDINCKLNYPSVMQYARQIPVSGFGTWRADYSREVLATFDERGSAAGGAGINEDLGNGLEITPSLYPAGTSTIDIVYGRLGAAQVATIGDTPTDIDFDGALPDELLRPFDINRLSLITGCSVSGTNSVLTGFDDWSNLQLPFVVSGVDIDGFYPDNSNDDITGQVFGELVLEGSKGKFSGLLSPIVQVAFDDLPDGVKQYPSTGTAKLQFTYERLERDGGGLYPPGTVLKAKLFKIAEGLNEPNPPTTKVPVPLRGGDQFRFDSKNMTWVYNLDLTTLDPNFIYGVEVWRDAIGDGGVGPLDNNGDGFAGFFFVKK